MEKMKNCIHLGCAYMKAEALREISTDGRILKKSRRMRLAGHVARMGTRRCVYRVLAGKPEGKRPLGRHRHRWEDNIKIDLQELGCGGMDWTELAQVKDCECGNESLGSIKCGGFLD
jgi:hypothetical protein